MSAPSVTQAQKGQSLTAAVSPELRYDPALVLQPRADCGHDRPIASLWSHLTSHGRVGDTLSVRIGSRSPASRYHLVQGKDGAGRTDYEPERAATSLCARLDAGVQRVARDTSA